MDEKIIEHLLVQLITAENTPQGNDDVGKYEDRIRDEIDKFKKIINPILNMEETTENDSLKTFAFSFMNMLPELELAAKDSKLATMAQLKIMENHILKHIDPPTSEVIDNNGN